MSAAQGLGRSCAWLAALAALGGCWWHDSDVPAIEQADRARRAPLRDGVYCGVVADASGLSLESDCVRLTWVRSERRMRVTEIDAEEGAAPESAWLDLASLGHGLTAMQYDEAQEGDGHGYSLFVIVARRQGYVAVPLPASAVRNVIAKEEGVTIEPSSDYGRILEGKPTALRRLMERSAIAWLEAEAPAGVDKLAPYDPQADDEHVPPHYVLRIEALDDDLEESAAIEKSVARLREALERTAERLE